MYCNLPLILFVICFTALSPETENSDSEPVESDESLHGEGWRNGDLQEAQFPNRPNPTEPDEVKCPLEYFSYYFDDELISIIVEETNLYTSQKTGKSLNVTPDEIRAFIGIMIFMGIIHLPAMTDYWAESTFIPQVAEVMPRRRFQNIRSNIHFHNNEIEGDDRLLKIRPLLDHLRKKCQSLEMEYDLSVDERMERYKGTRAGNMRQYMPDKPSAKWGFKIFVLAGASGLTYDFIPYCGQQTFDAEPLTDGERKLGVGAMAVIALCKCISNPEHCTVTFDNYYTGIPLITYLKSEMKLHSLGTIRRNRIPECPLKEAKDLMKEGRGSYESFVNKNAVSIVQWADNKAVILASSCVGVEPSGRIKRYCKVAKAKIDVPCPKAVIFYNKTMGGVDLADEYMALYKVPTRARRWYFPLFGYSLELALTNAYLTYKRECAMLGIPQEFPTSKDFRLAISRSLTACMQRTKGRPSLDRSLSRKKIHRPMVARPVDALRTDGMHHYPTPCKKNRCRYCPSGFSRMSCTKCNAVLCIRPERNCFIQFHCVPHL